MRGSNRGWLMGCWVAVLVGGVAWTARAEKVPLKPAEMLKMSTDVIVGKVQAVYSFESKTKDYLATHHVAEVVVDKVEKGSDLRPGQLVYVRFWNQHWIGPGRVPPGTSGHRGMAGVGETARYYLVTKGYDGGGQVADGGYNVVFNNGCEVLKPAAEAKAPPASKR